MIRCGTRSRPELPVLSASLLAACVSLCAADARADSARDEPGPSAARWAYSASASAYFVPDDPDYLQPTISADHGWLHLEVSYNNEAMDTGSAWVGYNFETGDELSFAFTPKIGGVIGEIDGLTPGYHATLGWRALELYGECEYVLAFEDQDSYFYLWQQLTVSPAKWLVAGPVLERTRAYSSPRDVQWGLLLDMSYGAVGITANVFNPDLPRPTTMVALGVEF